MSGSAPDRELSGLLELTRVLERFADRVEHMLAGTWSGWPVHIWEYEYEQPSGPETRDPRHRRTAVAVGIPDTIGPVSIVPRTFLASAGAKLTGGERRTGDARFDQRFITSVPVGVSTDRVLTARARAWLEDRLRRAEVLIGYGAVVWLARSGAVNATDMLPLATGLAERVVGQARAAAETGAGQDALTAELVRSWDRDRRGAREAAAVRNVVTTVLIVLGILALLPLAAWVIFALSCSGGRCL